MLKGAAAVVATPEKAGEQIAQTVLADAGITKDLVARAAGLLSQFAKLDLMVREGNSREDSGEELADQIEKSIVRQNIAQLQIFLSNSVALPIDAKKALEVSATLEGITKTLWPLNPLLKIADLLDKDTVSMAYTLAGSNENNPGRSEAVHHIGEMLRLASGLEEKATLAEVAGVLHSRHVAFAEKILDHLEVFRSARDKQDILRQLQNALYSDEGDGAQARITEHGGHVLQQIEGELKKNYDSYTKEVADGQLADENVITERWNSSLESRGAIYCDVSQVSTSQRPGNKLFSFRIKPAPVVRGAVNGLTRMHIEHLRQSLYQKANKLNEFVTGEPIIHEKLGSPEDGIIIDTSDSLLVQELQRAAEQESKIQIPNRLQTIPFKRR